MEPGEGWAIGRSGGGATEGIKQPLFRPCMCVAELKKVDTSAHTLLSYLVHNNYQTTNNNRLFIVAPLKRVLLRNACFVFDGFRAEPRRVRVLEGSRSGTHCLLA
ncbi:unnamed protein product, partial [Laminaria digitata]